MPLFMQESYLDAYGFNKTADKVGLDGLRWMAEQADCISLSEVLSSVVHVEQEWSLLPNVGILGCVAPSILNPRSYCQWSPFPALMGKMSTMRKISRMIKELKEVTGNKILASQSAALIEYVPLIFEMVMEKLESGNKEDSYEAV